MQSFHRRFMKYRLLTHGQTRNPTWQNKRAKDYRRFRFFYEIEEFLPSHYIGTHPCNQFKFGEKEKFNKHIFE